jgi:hypothetical protein
MNEQASEKQISYINDLLNGHRNAHTPVDPNAPEFVQRQNQALNEEQEIYRTFWNAVQADMDNLSKADASTVIDFLKGSRWADLNRAVVRQFVGEQAYNIGAVIAVSGPRPRNTQIIVSKLGTCISEFVQDHITTLHGMFVPIRKIDRIVDEFLANNEQDNDELWLEYHCLANC